MSFPIVGITLLAKNGYFFQRIESGEQVEEPAFWKVDDFLTSVDKKVYVEIMGERVAVGCWLYNIEGRSGYDVPLYFLHTDLEENSDWAKDITNILYGDGHEYRIKQEIILGMAGVKMLKELGYNNIEKFHMNEGHSALLALELTRELKDKDLVRQGCIFTTHTPVPAGHDKFPIKLVKEHLSEEIYGLLPPICQESGELNMTYLALDFSAYINGVAKKHAEVSKGMFPDYKINSITNGVHAQTWVSPHFERLYDEKLSTWRQDPASFKNATALQKEDVWNAHFEGKKQIIDFANAYTNAGLDYDYFTIGWARRFTSYKRPDFLLSDIERLRKIANQNGPIQIIYAGKAHKKDTSGKMLIEAIISMSEKLKGEDVTLVYLQNYDMYLSKFLTSGVDVWLNTPNPPHEASGTSGMKCALNGIPQLSVKDGWWEEGCVEGETGWSFTTKDDLYNLLENEIVPTFYSNRPHGKKLCKKP